MIDKLKTWIKKQTHAERERKIQGSEKWKIKGKMNKKQKQKQKKEEKRKL